MNQDDFHDFLTREARLFKFVNWVVSLDDDDPDSPGRQERRTITLNKIIEKAREALG